MTMTMTIRIIIGVAGVSKVDTFETDDIIYNLVQHNGVYPLFIDRKKDHYVA